MWVFHHDGLGLFNLVTGTQVELIAPLSGSAPADSYVLRAEATGTQGRVFRGTREECLAALSRLAQQLGAVSLGPSAARPRKHP